MALSDKDNRASDGEQGESEPVVKTCVLGGFSHTQEVKGLICSLPEVHGDALTRERSAESFIGKKGVSTLFTLTVWLLSPLFITPYHPQS